MATKYTTDQKASMLERAAEADKKAKRYASEERAYKYFEEGTGGGLAKPLKNSYTAGREAAAHKANMAESEAESLRVRATNSRSQYEHEKAQGDPSATSLSFEEWKKL